MVSAEREARASAEQETYWELQRAKSLSVELVAMRESLDDEEQYWALRRADSLSAQLAAGGDWGQSMAGTPQSDVSQSDASDFEAAAPPPPQAASPGWHAAGGLAPLPPPPLAAPSAATFRQSFGRQALSQLQGEIAQLSQEMGVSLHAGGLTALPPPPLTAAQPAAQPAANGGGYRQRVAAAHEHQSHETYWQEESGLRRQRSLSALAQQAEEEELSRGGSPLDWSMPSWLGSDAADEMSTVATEYLTATRRAAQEALALSSEVSKAALSVGQDMRGDVKSIVGRFGEHLGEVFTAPEALSEEDAYWQDYSR